MPRIYPFRAIRYNPTKVSLQDVITQPYDRITPSMQQAYYQKSPYNLVRIILGLPELFDSGEHTDVYTRAARDFKEWRESGVLAQETEPCVFAYSQRFSVPGDEKTAVERRGFIALGQLHPYSDGVVFRHEQTLASSGCDRLRLLKATRAHFEQIFMLYSDPGMSAERLLFNGSSPADIEVTDEYGALHRVWRIGDPVTINLLTTALEDKKLIIADGHHRYETALAYLNERCGPGNVNSERTTQSLPQPPYPEAAALMTFINMDAGELAVLPSHRVVFGLQGFAPEAFRKSAQPLFAIERLPSTGLDAALGRLKDLRTAAAFVAVLADGYYVMTAKPEAIAPALAAVSSRLRQLDVIQLDRVVLETLLGLSPQAVQEETYVRCLRDAGEAAAQVTRGEANAAFLMNPASMEQIREVAFAGEVMPARSTDFFPKLLSGLAIYALD